jgi:hypothetical protein
MKEMAGEGEPGADPGEALHQFGRAAEGVEEESLRRGLAGEGIEQGIPCFEGMDREGQCPLAGERELREEGLVLDGQRRFRDPAVEAAFADGGMEKAVGRV